MKVLNPIGVMQGRLLPKYQCRYQAHPVGYWQDEFPKAAELGLDCIEFILDFNDAEHNPLLRYDGSDEILLLFGKTGVKVSTVCADYFMEAPLHHIDKHIAVQSQLVLQRLLSNGENSGNRYHHSLCRPIQPYRQCRNRVLYCPAETVGGNC